MKPTREQDAVVDLLDVILDEGVIVEADVIISVADVALVGISLRAAIAGMTTMTEYGVFDEGKAERGIAADGPSADGSEDGRRVEVGPGRPPVQNED